MRISRALLVTAMTAAMSVWLFSGSPTSASRTNTTLARSRVVQMFWYYKQLHPHVVYISNGDRLRFCNRDPFYSQVFTPTTLYPYDRFDSPRVPPGKCWVTKRLLNRKRYQIQIKLFDELHSQTKAYVYIAPAKPEGFHLSLSVNNAAPPVGATVKLTAELNKTVIGTRYSVRIREVETRYVVQACGSKVTLGKTGKICTGDISLHTAGIYSFGAYVEDRNDPMDIVASSNVKTVSWR